MDHAVYKPNLSRDPVLVHAAWVTSVVEPVMCHVTDTQYRVNHKWLMWHSQCINTI